MNDALSLVRVADTAIKPAVRKGLMAKFGGDVTLDVIANVPKSALLNMDGIGKAGLQSCVDAIAEAFKTPATIMDELNERLQPSADVVKVTQQDFDRMIQVLTAISTAIQSGNFHVCDTAEKETEDAICSDAEHAE